MSVLVGTQLDLLSCLNTDNGIAQIEAQEPIADYIWFVSQDADINPEIYQYCEKLFTNNLLIGDLETYGMEMPENGAYKKKATNAQSYKKGKTNGLQDLALSPIYGDIRLLQLAGLDSEKILVVDFKTKWDRCDLSAKYVEFLDWLIEKIRQFAKRKGVLIGHNIGFDLGFLRAKYGIKFWKAYDTMIMSQLLSAGILTHKHGLKDCCNRYLGIEVDKTEQSADNSLPLRNAQINYAASDIVNTGELFLILKNEIRIAGLEVVTEIEAEFTPALVEINYWGMPVDLTELDRQIKWYFAKLMEIDLEFQQIHPGLNIRSSQQIAGIISMLNKKDDDQDEELEEQLDSVETEVFEAIKVVKAQGSSKSDLALLNDHRVVQLVVDFRTVSIYLNYCQQVKQEIVWIEGVPRVSGSIRQLTRKGQGRTCSGNKKAPVKCQGVNIQNPPQTAKAPQRLLDSGCPNLRAIFQAPRVFPIPKNPVFLLSFYYLLDVELLFCYLTMNMRTIDQDLPAAHLAIATYFSGETVIAEAAKNKIDLHAITMKTVFDAVNDYAEYRHMDVKQITKINKDEEHTLFKKFDKIRGICKNVVYGSLNRQSAPTLQNTIKVQQKEEVPLHICEGMIEAFPKVFPRIAGILDSLWKKANNRIVKIDGHDYGVFYDDDATFHTPGYRRRIYSFCKKNAYGRIYVSTSDVANCWLATEASVMKRAIARIYQRAVLEQNLDLRLGSICHDEVVATCYQYQATDCAQIIKEETLAAMQHFTWDHENNKPKLPYPAMEKPAYKLVRDGWSH
jgi:DNA polymerase I-like protein with 3'-5' exonuclease and polymerase domains